MSSLADSRKVPVPMILESSPSESSSPSSESSSSTSLESDSESSPPSSPSKIYGRPQTDVEAAWKFILSQPPRKNRKTPAEQEASIEKYYDIVGETEGFDSVPDSDSDSDMMGDIRPCGVNGKGVELATEFAMEEYNKKKLMDEGEEGRSRLILEKVVKANHQCVAGIMYYITLQAKNEVEDNPSSSSSSFYEVRVHLGVNDYKALELFRPAKFYKSSD